MHDRMKDNRSDPYNQRNPPTFSEEKLVGFLKGVKRSKREKSLLIVTDAAKALLGGMRC